MGGLIRASGWGSQRLASMWASVMEVAGLGACEDKGKDVFRNNVCCDRNCGLGREKSHESKGWGWRARGTRWR